MIFKKVWKLLFIICGIGLSACFSDESPTIVESNLSSPVPVTRVVEEERVTAVPTPTVDPIPRVLQSADLIPEHINCDDFQDRDDVLSFWVDDMIPGESTYDEALEIVRELPTEEKPILELDSMHAQNGSDYYYWLDFGDEGLLFGKREPRYRLDDIISHYGAPSLVIWEELRPFSKEKFSRLSLSTTSTVLTTTSVTHNDRIDLFFPEANATFVVAEHRISFLAPELYFLGFVYTQSDYERLTTFHMERESEEGRMVYHFEWPC